MNGRKGCRSQTCSGVAKPSLSRRSNTAVGNVPVMARRRTRFNWRRHRRLADEFDLRQIHAVSDQPGADQVEIDPDGFPRGGLQRHRTQPGDDLRVDVRDLGDVGQADHRSLRFDPFFQAHDRELRCCVSRA